MKTDIDRRLSLPNYELTETLYQSSKTEVYRAVRSIDNQAVVIKLLRSESATCDEILHFRNQYEIAKNLHIPSIVRPLCMEACGNSYALVMADCGSISLRQYIQSRSLSVRQIIAIALQLSKTLGYLHQNRIIHKDIKPSNILIHPRSKQIKLIDFSIALQLDRETTSLADPSQLEGTLAYMSPEQTGRMNRILDYRTDFYSLGATLYELLAGQLPFAGQDALELVYCHLSKQPPSLGNRQQETGNREEIPSLGNRQQETGNREEIPSVLADIVMKLMAKNAEDRYQSAAGLQADLQHCLAEIKTTGTVRDFEIGKLDRISQLNIPQKLYGRETQIQQLLAAFDRASKGKGELVVISGYSGIGKTALVRELFKPLTQQQAYFISGKFDQFKRDIPYACVSEAYRGLIRQILTEKDDRIAAWRDRFQTAVGENGQLVIDVIPELELLIGKQPPVPELNGTAAENRFYQTMVQFVLASRGPECPQIAFMDDVQWGDLATILSLRSILNLPEHQNRLLVAAYRDNEVDASHPLMQILAQLQADGIEVTQITLEPLSLEDATQFLMDALNADLLNIEASAVRPLAQLLYDKTQGNPFFLTQLLTSLHSEGLIWFDFKANIWQWDIDKIQQQNITDNVVELTIGKLQKLPTATQTQLQLAACIGNQFDLQTLATIGQQSTFQTMRSLWDAVQQGFVVALDRNYRAFLGDSEIAIIPTIQNSRFKFLHDRVQQAAYALIPENRKQETHLAIGRLLRDNTDSDILADNVFEIVNHLKQGISLIRSTEEQVELVNLCLLAGRKAKAAVAYDSALNYLNAGLSLLTDRSWQDCYYLTLDMYLEAIEVSFLSTDFETSQQLANVTLKHAKNLLDRVRVYEIEILANTAKNQNLSALEIVLNLLKELEINLAEQSPDNLDVEGLIYLPEMTAPDRLAAMRLLVKAYGLAAMSAPDLLPKLIFTAIELCLEFGNSAMAAVTYVFYGLILVTVFEDIDAGYRWGKLAINLLDRFNSRPYYCLVHTIFNFVLKHWKDPIRETIAPAQNALNVGIETGDLFYAGCTSKDTCTNLFFAGETLDIVAQNQASSLEFLNKIKQQYSIYYAGIWYQLVLNLQGNAENQSLLVGAGFDETEMLPMIEADRNRLLLFNFYLAKGILFCFWGDYDRSVVFNATAREYIETSAGMTTLPTHNFYESLALLAKYSAKDLDREADLQQIEANQNKMRKWVSYAAHNFQNKYDLIEAERSRLSGKIYETMELYDRAIEGAIANNYIQEAALANERAAEFYLGIQKPKIAQAYLKEAHLQYQQWGGIAKVRQLETLYPEWLAAPEKNANFKRYNSISPDSTISKSSSSTGGEFLDLAAVIKAAEAISSELVFDKLLDRLLQILLENSGAQTGCIVLEREGKLFVEVANPAPDISGAIALEESTNFPVTVLQYVARTQESLVIANATTDDICAADPYVLKHQPKSILCTPIVRQEKFIGLVYLENNLAATAFTSERLEVVKILMGQAAIALENTRLYQTLQQSETKFRAFVEGANDVIYSIDGEGAITYLSPQFKEMWGYEVDEYLHQSFGPLIHPEDLPKVITANQLLFETGEKQAGLEFRTKHRDGEWFWITCNFSPIKDARGEIVGFRGIARDISDRKHAEAALAESEAYHRNLFEQSSIGLALCNMKGELLYVNTAYANIIGRTPAEVLPLTYWEITPEKYAADEQIQLQNLQTKGCYGPYEKEYIHKDGRLIPVQLSGVIVERHGEKLIWSSVEDIRDRKAAEAKLHDRELFLRSTYEGVSQGICVVDVTTAGDFRFVGWNPLLEKLTGIPSTNIVGKNPEELLGASYGGTVRQNYERCRSAETVISYEEFLPFEGKDFWWLTTLNPLKDEMGCIYRIIITTIEITDRKAAETVIQQKNQELEQALTQIQHSQAQVVQSEKMSALGNLVAGVAHEINNPIGFLNGSISNAKEQVQELLAHLELYQQHYPHPVPQIQEHEADIDLEFTIEDLPKLLNSMQAASDRIKGISKSLRTFSRADTEYKVSANLHDGIDSTLLILKYRLKANQYRPAIEVIQEYGDLPQIECFPGQLNQVFMNILANAIDMFDEMSQTLTFAEIKANPQQITIRTEVIAGRVEIRIRDNGKGMNKEVQAKIFDHLFTTKPVGKGTGLGLAIARQIVVEKHGGEIIVNSTLGKGTEFAIALPL